jgi:phospholipase D1/2
MGACCKCLPRPHHLHHAGTAAAPHIGTLPAEAPTPVLLHGVLEITIAEMDTSRLPKFLQAVQNNLGGVIATVELPPVKVARTLSASRAKTVSWHESFRVFCAHEVASIDVLVHSGVLYKGRAKVAVSESLLSGEKLDGWFNLEADHEGTAKIHLIMQFQAAKLDKYWNAGLAGGAFEGVSHTFFPLRKGCKVTPYHNAHIDDSFSPNIMLETGKLYQPGKAWEDLYWALDHAKHFIYIAGWSVNARISLVRDPEGRELPGNLGETLGSLLIRKANQGVSVLCLVWDDKTDNLDKHRPGIMHSHDEDTAAYFRNTKVKFLLCPRNPDAKEFQLAEGFIFTHHQKVVVMDYPDLVPDSNQRRLVAFQGGIDLCDGRYDTPSHPLFKHLTTLFKNDFCQGSIPGASLKLGGPREPWHDGYSKLEGSIAWDVHTNFTQRWLKQAGEERLSFLVPIDDTAIFCPPSAVTDEDDTEAWNVQLFRSIDDTSVVGFPQEPADILKLGLIRQAAGNVTERSVQDAYIQAIRRAKRFLYIENQYFLGSSHAWDSSIKDDSAVQLIPLEIALKIVSKIHAGEPFSVYIVNPLWPHGSPTSTSGQDICLWHRKTLEMMYGMIAKALKDTNRLNENPTDYLGFFSLGNREAPEPNEYVPEQRPKKGTNYQMSQDNRRFMIYCHAKMMVVDDEYVIIGSANINQRSMDGGRDTEISMGAFQPCYTVGQSPDYVPRAGVYGFRMSMWFEHLALREEVFNKPWTKECMKRVTELATQYWEEYSRPEPITDMKGHLLRYPYVVKEDGMLGNVPGFECFPDTNGHVLGAEKPCLPRILTV